MMSGFWMPAGPSDLSHVSLQTSRTLRRVALETLLERLWGAKAETGTTGDATPAGSTKFDPP